MLVKTRDTSWLKQAFYFLELGGITNLENLFAQGEVTHALPGSATHRSHPRALTVCVQGRQAALDETALA
jgi:hypothetical protein